MIIEFIISEQSFPLDAFKLHQKSSSKEWKSEKVAEFWEDELFSFGSLGQGILPLLYWWESRIFETGRNWGLIYSPVKENKLKIPEKGNRSTGRKRESLKYNFRKKANSEILKSLRKIECEEVCKWRSPKGINCEADLLLLLWLNRIC